MFPTNLARDLLETTKPRIAMLVLLTVLTGATAASKGRPIDAWVVLSAVVGAGLVAGGSCVLNHWIERNDDRRMPRTARRPLAAGRLSSSLALGWAATLIFAGSTLLTLAVNPTAAVLALLSGVLYVGAYTPLKKIHSINTVVGAIPGAMPALIGWYACSPTYGPIGGLLFGLIFLWQFPHFHSIAWLYRDDYELAAMKMVAGTSAGRRSLFWKTPLVTVMTALVGAWCVAAVWESLWGAVASIACGLPFLRDSLRFAVDRTDLNARKLMFASLIYLPIQLLMLIAGSLVG